MDIFPETFSEDSTEREESATETRKSSSVSEVLFSWIPYELLDNPIIILLELVLVSLYALLVNTVRFTVKGLKLDGKLVTLFIYAELFWADKIGAKYFESKLLLNTTILASTLFIAWEITSAYCFALNSESESLFTLRTFDIP